MYTQQVERTNYSFLRDQYMCIYVYICTEYSDMKQQQKNVFSSEQ